MPLAPDFNPKAAPPADAGRVMTPGEIAMARTVFGNSIDYSKVRIHTSSYLPAQVQGDNVITPNGEMYCSKNYCNDFSQEGLETRKLFIHEMTHVWQYQNHVLDPRLEAVKELIKHFGRYSDTYAYKLDKSKDLTDYNLEQQAHMVEDYYAARQPGAQRTQDDADREVVMKKFIANPSYARSMTWGEMFHEGLKVIESLPRISPVLPF